MPNKKILTDNTQITKIHNKIINYKKIFNLIVLINFKQIKKQSSHMS